MSAEFHQLLDVTIEHLESLQATGAQFVPLEADTFRALNSGVVGNPTAPRPAKVSGRQRRACVRIGAAVGTTGRTAIGGSARGSTTTGTRPAAAVDRLDHVESRGAPYRVTCTAAKQFPLRAATSRRQSSTEPVNPGGDAPTERELPVGNHIAYVQREWVRLGAEPVDPRTDVAKYRERPVRSHATAGQRR